MSTSDDTALYPVTAYEVMPMRGYGSVIIRMDFLSHALQEEHAAHPGRKYVLTLSDARRLAEQIFEQCAQVQSDAQQSPPEPLH